MTNALRFARTLTLGVSTAALIAMAAAPAAAQRDPNQSGTAPLPGSAPRNADVTGDQRDPNQNPAVPTSGSATTQNAGGTAATNDDVVVTGTLFRRTNTETPSPVTTLTAANLDQRGITTVADAVQSISAGNGGGLPQNFTANGAFAAGAQGISLRGLTTDSTLVLFDGLRAANYPLADDGARSFVDLNTIPDAIVDRVEVLRDGASANYGADAIAGVVNVILKKEITGVTGRVEAGASERGDDGGQRAQLTAGYGKLSEQGFNFYISGEYQHSDEVFDRDRGFPYNTANLTSIGGKNGNAGVVGAGATISAVVRPATETIPGNILSGSSIAGTTTSILAGACAPGTAQHTAAAGSFCEQDLVNTYGVLAPEQTHYGVTAHLTANIGSKAQAYLVGTYYASDTYLDGTPSTIRSTNPIYTANIVLPATLTNGAVNPYDPYANIVSATTGQRESALLYYRFGDIPTSTKYASKTYRVAGGIDGTFGDDWGYSIAGTYMKNKLNETHVGVLNLAGLTNAINTGAYNFINPSLNSVAVDQSIAPTYVSRAESQVAQGQATITKKVFQLPGGPLQVGVGGQFRYEEVNDPNQDTGLAFIGVNTFQAIGHRYVTAGYFEVNAPIVDQFEVDVAGRYDHYSQGFGHFSPKVGAKFTPIPQVALRGTFSTGFRAPSIPETQGAVIGYVPYTLPAAVVAAHGNDTYVQPYSLGLFSAGNPNLKPETARNFTGGVVLQPKSWLSATFDYYNIRKKNLIQQNGAGASVANAYLASGTLPTGLTTITLNPVDPQYPNLPATPAVINALYYNATSLNTSGIDGQIQATVPVAYGIKLTSILEGTEILQYKIDNGDGTFFNYVGTLGSYNITSASGTPRWRANWQNTAEVGPYSLSLTTYFTSGYKGYADDYLGQGCQNVPALTPAGTALQCTVKHFLDFDLTGQVKVNKQFTFYINVINLFNAHAPFDPNTYGGVNYNPAWSTSGVIGRYFRGGATFKF